NKINYRVNPSLRLQGKFNYSDTKDQVGDTNDATFTEAAVGFAYRPINHDRLNVLGRITYLYDLQPVSQSIEPDEKSLIASLESSYQLNQRWELGGKLAHKEGEIRSDRDAGNWSRNDATLAAVRVRYHMTKNWDAMAQYHWLNSDESQDTQHGAMIAVDRHIGENMKIGLGYNFTNFNDDLSNTDGDAEGWFINLVGKY
ncbi:MtrB/PioB family outer membrane beta-barrel protein, partial [Cocleimonas flava]